MVHSQLSLPDSFCMYTLTRNHHIGILTHWDQDKMAIIFQATSHYLNQWCPSLLVLICVSQPLWVNSWCPMQWFCKFLLNNFQIWFIDWCLCICCKLPSVFINISFSYQSITKTNTDSLCYNAYASILCHQAYVIQHSKCSGILDDHLSHNM